MSPMPHIGEYVEKKKKSNVSWYLLSIVIGVGIFAVLLFFTKSIILIVKFAINHYIYCGIGVLILWFLISRIKKRRRKKREREYADRYR